MSLAELIGATSAFMLRQFDPELAHTFAVLAMRLKLAPAMPTPVDKRLEVPTRAACAPVASSCSGVRALSVACVPTGINAGVWI